MPIDVPVEDRRLEYVADQTADAADATGRRGAEEAGRSALSTSPSTSAEDEGLSDSELRHWADVYARDDSAPTETGDASPHVIFQVGGERFAVPLDELDEVARVEVGIGLNHASSLVLGLVNIRGEVVPVLDTAAALGTRGTYRLGNANRTLVVRDARDRRTALPVDGIETIDQLDAALFQGEGADTKAPIRRVAVGEYAGGSLTLLDLSGLRRAGSAGAGDDSFQ
jgi:chemotaxis signal transduction protein